MAGQETLRPAFWELPLESLNRDEWEALCDGCARCCMKKLQDEDSGETHYTRVVCHLLEPGSGRCGDYARRQQKVPDCVILSPGNLPTLNWIPDTCAYRLRAENKPLPAWHPLLTGSREAMESAGITLGGRVISEAHVHPDGLEEHIIRWVKAAC